ncbi:MAG: twin-arginine translocase subunit TatC [Holosporales bacterium]
MPNVKRNSNSQPQEENGDLPPIAANEDSAEGALIHHLLELRERLLYVIAFFAVCFGVAYFFAQDLFALMVKPLAAAFGESQGRRLIYTGLAEAFVTYLKIAFFTAGFVTLPLLAMQVWKFIAPGLYANERKTFFPFLVATPLLFFCGGIFAYTVIIPNAWAFFLQFETPAEVTALSIQLEARVGEYLALTMQLVMAFGICFLLPVLLVLLGRIGILTVSQLAGSRRYAFVGIMALAALITPPDVLSMIGLALPLYGLYEVSIVLLRLLVPKK